MTKMMASSDLKHLVQLYHKNKEVLDDQILTIAPGILSSLVFYH